MQVGFLSDDVACNLLSKFFQGLPGIEWSGTQNSLDRMQILGTFQRIAIKQDQVRILAFVHCAHG